MPNFISVNNKWYACTPDPTKAQTAWNNVKNNLTISAGTTDAQIITELNKADTTWKCFKYGFAGDAYEQNYKEGGH